MPAASVRSCPTCGARRRGNRCDRCGWRSASNYKPTRPDLQRSEWKLRSAKALREHRALFGDWCPGWPASGHEPHAERHLALHHHTEDPDGPASVLCREENGRLGKPDHGGTADGRGGGRA